MAVMSSCGLTVPPVASSTTRPFRNTVTSSATVVISAIRCEMNATATPRSHHRSTWSNNQLTICSPRVEVGSSRMRTEGESFTALAISTRCRCDGDSWRTDVSGLMPTIPSSSSSRAVLTFSCCRATRPNREVISRRKKTFSATVSSLTRLSSWCTTAMPADRASSGERHATSSPLYVRKPVSGFCTPARILMSVLFPAPFSPRMARVSPTYKLRLTPFNATVAPKRLLMSRHSSVGC